MTYHIVDLRNGVNIKSQRYVDSDPSGSDEHWEMITTAMCVLKDEVNEVMLLLMPGHYALMNGDDVVQTVRVEVPYEE